MVWCTAHTLALVSPRTNLPGDDQLHLPQKLFVVGPVRKTAKIIYKRTTADIRQREGVTSAHSV